MSSRPSRNVVIHTAEFRPMTDTFSKKKIQSKFVHPQLCYYMLKNRHTGAHAINQKRLKGMSPPRLTVKK